MTGFARNESAGEYGELAWELRSVNHRYLDVAVRLPEELRQLENQVRERVNARLNRGKVDCTLRYKPAGDAAAAMQINRRLAEQVIAAAAELGRSLPDSRAPGVMDILRWPGVTEVERPDLEPVQVAATELLEQTLDGLVAGREREGERLADLLRRRCEAMAEQVDLARQRMPEVLAGLRERLRARIAELVAEIDSDRLEQELAYLAQKLDVSEEMDRLETHVAEVTRLLTSKKPVGRRLDFLMQEMNREANTLGSKSADSATTAVSVEMKVLIEQMREQIQNIE